MAANAWDSDNVDIALETGIQSPQHVVGIKQRRLAEQPVFDGLHQAELF